MNQELNITIRRALAGLNLEGYAFKERSLNGGSIEYHVVDTNTQPGCGNCSSDNLLSKGFTKCAYRHFVEDKKRSYIVVHKRKYACYDCGQTTARSPLFTQDACRFTSSYMEHLSMRILEEKTPAWTVARHEMIPLSTLRKVKRHITKPPTE